MEGKSLLLIILLFALFPNHSIRLFHPVLWSTSASLALPPPHAHPPPLFVRVCAPKLTVKRANRKIITVKESTNGAFPRLTSIIITPRTRRTEAETRPGGRRTNGRVRGERTRSQRAAWQAGRRGAGVQVLVALRACVRLAPSFPRSPLPASSSSFP